MRIAILDDYAGIARSLADWSALSGRAEIVVFREPLDDTTAADRLADFDVLCSIRERMAFPESLLARLPRLKLLTIIGTGLPGLDLAAAARHGIRVCNARGATDDRAFTQGATPELAWGLLLALVRHIPEQDQRERPAGWQTRPGTILCGKTMGILGLGNLGRRVAAYAQAFGMEVIAWSQNLTDEAARAVGVERVEKAALFARSDALSIHLRLSERSRGLVGAAELAAMKPGAVLINTARGPIVDGTALVAALSEGRIGGAGLDVFDVEPLPAGHPLRALPNVVLTPHLGYFTEELMGAFYRGTVATVTAFLDGAPAGLLN
jgi:phosphoglycerate dehydrogenase-like enzyme